jgi:ubiquinone/menaquinone biosynthesis C-methylase UbiE
MDTAPDYWGSKAAEYDSLIRRVVPRYDEMIGRLLEALPPSPEGVLELGCGTGNLSLELARTLPTARFTFVDAAPEMLEVTRSRLVREAPEVAARAHFVAARFEDLQLDSPPGDLVIASLSLHHVADLEPVYRAISAWLRPGGAIRCVDGVRGAAKHVQSLHLQRWLAFWREPGNLAEDEITSVADHVARHDHYWSIEEHFQMLERAGFVCADCIWRDGLFAILTAEVP